MRSHQQLLGGFPEVCPCPVESHSGSQAPSPRQSARDVGNPQHSSLRACQHPNQPLHPMSPPHAGLSPWQHPGGDGEEDTGGTPALGTPPGSPCAGGKNKPRDGSFSVLGNSTTVGREADGKGRQTIISVFGSHSRVFSPLSQMSSIF